MKKHKSFLDQIAERDPEIAAEIRRDEEAGLLREPPRNYRQCSDWRDGWLYIFKQASLDPSDFMRLEGEKATTIVWIGPNFADHLVELLGKMTEKLGPNTDLVELRLIRTNLSQEGVQKLKRLLPKARITLYGEDDQKKNPRLAYADPSKAKQMFPDDANST